MPIIKSAKKRVRVSAKAATRNSKTKRSLRAAIKSFHAAITGSNINKAQSELDKAVKKGVISKNKAARKKKQLATAAKAAGVKPAAAAKSTAKKAPAKTAPAKKTTVKTAAKTAPKAAANKPAKTVKK